MNIKKSLWFFMIVWLIPLFVNQGCNKTVDIDETEIKEIEIIYEAEKDTYECVNIDFETHTRAIKSYGNEKQEKQESFSTDREFQSFIKENILTDIAVHSRNDDDSDTMRLIWSIQVWAGEEHYNMKGFEGDAYPPFWNELLEYMEI